MNSRSTLALSAALGLAALAPQAFAARAAADILPPQRREVSVNNGQKLAQRQAPPALPAETPNPFNPPNFEQPDPDSLPPAPPPSTKPGTPGAPVVARPPGDRDILGTLAMRLTPSGTFVRGGKPILVIDRNRFEVGTKFIVSYNEHDYELELVSIDRTTFTLRYRGEEITRPITPVK
ncbi:MAG: hypothetical protein V4773_09140 [Verrucomicrobiota bacterium]